MKADDRFVVEFTGCSMHPVVPPGACLECRGDLPPQPGDIVVFNTGEGLVAHRVLECQRGSDGRQVLTAGDLCAHTDGLLGEEQLLGVVTTISARGRQVDCHRRPVRALFRSLLWSRRHRAHPGAGHDGTPPVVHRLWCHLVAALLWRRLD